MGDLILIVGMICALLTSVGALVGGVWNLLTLHWATAGEELIGACVAAALVVTFDRAQRIRRD